MHVFYKYFYAIAALVLIFAVSCDDDSSTETQNTDQFSAFLADDSGEPLAGAIVNAEDTEKNFLDSDTTNEEGYFEIFSIPDDHSKVNLQISHKGEMLSYIKLSEFKKQLGEGDTFTLDPPDTCCNEVTVTVKNEDEPLYNAEVRLNKGKDVIEKHNSDSSGVVKFDSLCDGEYWFRIAMEGYKVQEHEFSVSECDSAGYSYTIEAKSDEEDCCNVIKVKVRDDEENEINEAKVQLKRNGNLVKETFTNDDGFAVFENVCDGEFGLRIVKNGFKVAEEGIAVDNCETKLQEITLQRSGEDCCNNIKVKVRNENEEELHNIPVELKNHDGLIEKVNTNADGWAVFDGICDGEYWIRIKSDHYELFENDFAVEDCETKIIEATLISKEDCCNNIKVKVRNENDEELHNIPVELKNHDGLVEKVNTNADGWAVFDGICDGEYWIRIKSDHYELFENDFAVEDCDTKIIEATLKEGEDCCNKIIYTVKNNEGEPLHGVEVKLTNSKTKEHWVKETNSDGKVVFEDVCDGTYWVRIAKDGYDVVEKEVGVENCETKEKTVVLTHENECCEGILKVIPKDSETGDHIFDAKVRLWQGGEKLEVAHVNEDGIAIIDNICEETYWVDILSETHQNIEFEVEIPCNETVQVSKELAPTETKCCNNRTEIIPVDSESGEVLNGAKVRFWKDGKLLRTKFVENNKVVFEEICKGNHGIDILMEGYNSIEFHYEFDCEEDKQFIKEMELKE